MDELNEMDYLADVLKGKCRSFMLDDKRQVVEYQISFKQWKANKGLRQKLHATVRKHLGMDYDQKDIGTGYC